MVRQWCFTTRVLDRFVRSGILCFVTQCAYLHRSAQAHWTPEAFLKKSIRAPSSSHRFARLQRSRCYPCSKHLFEYVRTCQSTLEGRQLMSSYDRCHAPPCVAIAVTSASGRSCLLFRVADSVDDGCQSVGWNCVLLNWSTLVRSPSVDRLRSESPVARG